jgi:hypothetical protein
MYSVHSGIRNMLFDVNIMFHILTEVERGLLSHPLLDFKYYIQLDIIITFE